MSKNRKGANEAGITQTQMSSIVNSAPKVLKPFGDEIAVARKNRILSLLCAGGFFCLRCGVKIQSSLSRGELVSRWLMSRVNFLCAKCHETLFYRRGGFLFPRPGRRFEVDNLLYSVPPESSTGGSLGDISTGRENP